MFSVNEITVHAEARYNDMLREAEAERMLRTGQPGIRVALLCLVSHFVALVLNRL